MEVIRLTPEDCDLLSARFAEYDNSQRRMEAAFAEDAGDGNAASSSLARLRALRRLERKFAIDLGSLCHRFQRREDPALHPLERSILHSIALWRRDGAGSDELWIFLDRIRQLRQIIGEEYTEWLEPARG